jgi:outer membrane protein assembly factor BamB
MRVSEPTKSGWRTRIQNVQRATLPPGTTRPNPLVSGDRVFASIFSPGAICCLAKKTGDLLWRTNLDHYGGAAVTMRGGILFATSARTLYALERKTGRIRWEFTPYSEPGEWIYSQPSVSRVRVFIGDREGYFHCIDAKNGRLMWRRLTSRACNNQMNLRIPNSSSLQPS